MTTSGASDPISSTAALPSPLDGYERYYPVRVRRDEAVNRRWCLVLNTARMVEEDRIRRANEEQERSN